MRRSGLSTATLMFILSPAVYGGKIVRDEWRWDGAAKEDPEEEEKRRKKKVTAARAGIDAQLEGSSGSARAARRAARGQLGGVQLQAMQAGVTAAGVVDQEKSGLLLGQQQSAEAMSDHVEDEPMAEIERETSRNPMRMSVI